MIAIFDAMKEQEKGTKAPQGSKASQIRAKYQPKNRQGQGQGQKPQSQQHSQSQTQQKPKGRFQLKGKANDNAGKNPPAKRKEKINHVVECSR